MCTSKEAYGKLVVLRLELFAVIQTGTIAAGVALFACRLSAPLSDKNIYEMGISNSMRLRLFLFSRLFC
jgi:hypothetical protein